MTEENKRDLWGRDDLIEVTPWADFIVSEKKLNSHDPVLVVVP